jgi:hypothetical protein
MGAAARGLRVKSSRALGPSRGSSAAPLMSSRQLTGVVWPTRSGSGSESEGQAAKSAARAALEAALMTAALCCCTTIRKAGSLIGTGLGAGWS